MAKLFYNNHAEQIKWKITQDFINKHVDSTKFIWEGFGGLGNITEMYAKTGALVQTIEIDEDTFLQLQERMVKYPEVLVEHKDSFKDLQSYPDNFWDVVDLDPWTNAGKYISECMRVLNNPGYILLTSGEPYAISRFKAVIKKYGSPPIVRFEDYAQELFKKHIKKVAEEEKRTVELINYFNSSKICRLIVKVK